MFNVNDGCNIIFVIRSSIVPDETSKWVKEQIKRV